ncbi:MAG: class I SAM-dependent methyltransferase, partial [Rubrivivax sp.]|nr:class I SAM-dependent methyltransferase [Rubrivivax sp.]
MPELAPDRSAVRPVDAAALARVQRRLQRSTTAPWLHAEVARRMAQRLPVIRLQPDPVLDWASFTGASQSLLHTAYPRARVLAVEPDPQRLQATVFAQRKPWWQPWQKAAEVLAPENVPAGQAQLLWSNMALHGAIDPQALLRQWHQALAVDGFLMLSTLGPGTLVQ